MVYQSDPEPGCKVGFGGPSLGRNPDAQKQRRPVNQEQIEFSGEIGSTQLLEQGFGPALFLPATRLARDDNFRNSGERDRAEP